MKSYEIDRNNTYVLHQLRDDTFRGVYLTSRNTINYESVQHIRQSKVLSAKEQVQLLQMSILIQKHSCLKESFDYQILHFRSSGLIEYWLKSFSKTIKDIEDKKPKKLNIDQFIGIIKICAALYAFSFLVFIMELMTLKYEGVKKLINFFTFK